MLNLDISPEQAAQSQFCADGMTALNDGLLDDAITCFEDALKHGPNKDAYFGLGKAYSAQGDFIKAVKSLTDAMKVDPTSHDVLCFIGDLYYGLSQGKQAIESYAQAVALDPTVTVYKQKLVNIIGALKFKKINPNLKGVLLECLEDDTIEFYHFGGAWLSIMSFNSSVTSFYRLSKIDNYEAFKKGMANFSSCDGLIDPFFLTGLGKFIVPDVQFEAWSKNLRRYLMESISEGKQLFSDPSDIELITCALLKYNFSTDYISSISDEEAAAVSILKDKIENSDDPSLADVALFGCYKSICFLNNAVEIATKLQGGDHVSQIPKSQIEDYFAQQKIKPTITSLTKINDKVSVSVQEQYEKYPYPRWDVSSKDPFSEEVEGHLRGRSNVNILIAGCGTGKEAIQLAYSFPDAKITAVDLSLTSLAYAIHKSKQFGLENISFFQADIMELGEIDQRFDYIVSAGVLQHMHDPKAGWSVLNGLLKPVGLMRIALYSSQARWAINEARTIIENEKIGCDAESIRQFRNDISTHMKYKAIKNIELFVDFYALTECRDLLFHVHEHQFDLLDIKGILNDLSLEFLQFYLPPQTMNKYKKRNTHDPDAIDLDGWAKFESKNVDSFVSMYTFWCQKPSS
ncbi:MAG: methyltransferase domain-containing protein [Alphaproteobacteria bacterium]